MTHPYRDDRNNSQQIPITLPAEAVQFLEARVIAGEYPTVNEAVLQGIALLREQFAIGSDEWIRAEVLPALAEYDANPTGGRTSAQLRDSLSADAS